MDAALLRGLRVVEVSQLIAAPICALTLSDWGAEVVKVETGEGEYTRTLQPLFDDGESAYYYMLNRGKRGVAVDFRSDQGRELIGALLERADVVVESLGDQAKLLPLSAEEALAGNPKLIWCAITGTGRGDRGRALDPTLQASMGMMALNGEPDRPPMRLPVPLVDFATGLYATQSILAALLAVERGGEGRLLDCAMVDTAATLASSAGVYALSGKSPLRRFGTENIWYVPAANFEASDGEWVQLMAINEHHWKALCEALGHPQWASDPRFAGNDARLEHRQLVHSLIGEVIHSRPAEHWERAITESGAFCQRIREIEEAWNAPMLRARDLVRGEDREGPLQHPVPVSALSRVPPDGAPAPRLGEHTEEVARELGLR